MQTSSHNPEGVKQYEYLLNQILMRYTGMPPQETVNFVFRLTSSECV